MKKLASPLFALSALLIFHSCDWINKNEPAEVLDQHPSVAAATPAVINTAVYSGTVSEGPWASFHFPFKKPFTGDIRIKNLTIKFADGADASQSFYLGGIEMRNFPSDAAIDNSKPEKAINITRAGNHIDMVFDGAKFSGTVNGDTIEGEFEQKVSINDRNAGNTKDVYITAPIILYKQ